MPKVLHVVPKEPLSRIRTVTRRFGVLWTIARRPHAAPATDVELLERFQRLSEGVARTHDPRQTARFLWTVESLAFHCLLFRNRWPRFSDTRWPRKVMPMAHSGLGMAAALRTSFHPQDLAERIEDYSAPGFREFAWEAVGALVGLLANTGFRRTVQLSRALGLIRLPQAPGLPALGLADLPRLERRIAAHGYGRHLYFLRYRLGAALRALDELPTDDRGAATRGLAGALALVNVGDLATAVRFGEELEPSELAPVDDGIVNALVLLVWTQRRALDSIAESSSRAAHLVHRARAISTAAGHDRLWFQV